MNRPVGEIKYPTYEHERAALAITDFFRSTGQADSVLMVHSCTRGKAGRDTCLDLVVLVRPDVYRTDYADLEKDWLNFAEKTAAVRALQEVGPFSTVNLKISNGVFLPPEAEGGREPDTFELEIGNQLAYSVPLWQGGDYYNQLRRRWLPFYAEDLRHQRLTEVRDRCRSNLERTGWFVSHRQPFAALDRLYVGFQQFLQALFIDRRTYPLDYTRWIYEQVVEILNLPDLYARLGAVFEIQHFYGDDLAQKADVVRSLLEETTGE